MTQKRLKVGDIISSLEFAFGRRDYFRENEESAIIVGGTDKDHIVIQSINEETRVKHAALTGQILPKWQEVNYGAYSESRGRARFVVIRAVMEGGSTGGGMNRSDDYPDALHVTARRLNSNGTYNPRGELIKFIYQSFCYNPCVNEVTVHGQMQLSFK